MPFLNALVLGEKFTHSRNERVFRAHFGGPSQAISFLMWRILQRHFLPFRWNLDHFLMTLFFLKCPFTSLEIIASRFQISKQTLMRRVWQTLDLIDGVLPEVNLFKIYFNFNFNFFS